MYSCDFFELHISLVFTAPAHACMCACVCMFIIVYYSHEGWITLFDLSCGPHLIHKTRVLHIISDFTRNLSSASQSKGLICCMLINQKLLCVFTLHGNVWIYVPLSMKQFIHKLTCIIQPINPSVASDGRSYCPFESACWHLWGTVFSLSSRKNGI